MTYLKPTLLICIYMYVYMYIYIYYLFTYLGFPGGSVVKNLPANAEDTGSLGQEDPLGKEMATHSSILPGEFHGQRSLAYCSPWGCRESDTAEQLNSKSSIYLFMYLFGCLGFSCSTQDLHCIKQIFLCSPWAL